jgi:hypothetical protein
MTLTTMTPRKLPSMVLGLRTTDNDLNPYDTQETPINGVMLEDNRQ